MQKFFWVISGKIGKIDSVVKLLSGYYNRTDSNLPYDSSYRKKPTAKDALDMPPKVGQTFGGTYQKDALPPPAFFIKCIKSENCKIYMNILLPKIGSPSISFGPSLLSPLSPEVHITSSSEKKINSNSTDSYIFFIYATSVMD